MLEANESNGSNIPNEIITKKALWQIKSEKEKAFAKILDSWEKAKRKPRVHHFNRWWADNPQNKCMCNVSLAKGNVLKMLNHNGVHKDFIQN